MRVELLSCLNLTGVKCSKTRARERNGKSPGFQPQFFALLSFLSLLSFPSVQVEKKPNSSKEYKKKKQKRERNTSCVFLDFLIYVYWLAMYTTPSTSSDGLGCLLEIGQMFRKHTPSFTHMFVVIDPLMNLFEEYRLMTVMMKATMMVLRIPLKSG